MAKQQVIIEEFEGGISPFEKTGIKGAARFIRHLNIHEDPHRVTLLPAPAKVSGSTVLDLVKCATDTIPYATDKYFYDLLGNIYKETSAGTWSLDRATATIGNGAAGQGMACFDNFMYYATSTTIGRKGYLSGTPAYNDDFYTDGTSNIDQSVDSHALTYTLPTSIAETALARRSFVPARDPVKSIQVWVTAKGTADWLLTLHDQNNVSLGTVTLATASVTNGAYNTFTLTTPVRLTIGNTYHFHLTVASGTSTLGTSVSSDMTTAAYKTVFGILIADVDWHPMIEHLNFLAVGNANYIGIWDRAVYYPNKIQIKTGLKVRAFTKWKEYLVAAAVPDNSSDSQEECRLYYWSGTGDTYDFFDIVPFGFIDTIFNLQNKLVGIYGSDSAIYVGNSPFQAVQPMPNLARGKKVEVNPNGITSWLSKIYIGAGAVTDDASFEQGIYEYASKNDQFPEVLNYAFKISTGTKQSTSVKIGMVKAFGTALYWSWRDNTSYGVDKVLRTGVAQPEGEWESLIFDHKKPQKSKLALKLIVTFEPLATGESVTPKYRVDRAASFTLGTAVTTVGEVRAEIVLNKRFREFEFGFNLASSGGTYPNVTSIIFLFDDLEKEIDES